MTKAALISAGMKIFEAYGYRRSTIKMVAGEAGINRGSFTNYFRNKEELALEIIRKHTEMEVEQAQQALSKGSCVVDKISCYFNRRINELQSNGFMSGCLLGNLTNELSSDSPYAIKALSAGTEKIKSLIEKTLEDGQASGEITKTLQASVLAEFTYNTFQGAITASKASKSVKPLTAFNTQLPLILSPALHKSPERTVGLA